MRRKPVSDWTMDELKQILQRVRLALGEEDYKVMNAVVETLSYLTHLAKDKQAAEIYRILGSSKSEKTRNVLRVLELESAMDSEDRQDADESETPETAEPASVPEGAKGSKKAKGHGRNPADDYKGARQIRVSLESMKPGDRCPCGQGNLYEIDDSPLVRIVGQAPLHADVYRLERLRCNTCGDVFTATAPEGVGSEKYDATSTAMVALTLFLRIPGAPLDSSIVERALKKAILHRRNSLFYKTQRGARVGDLFMSLIYSCQLSDVNPLDYLTVLLRNADRLAREPAHWMPWNYSETLASFAPASPSN